MTWWMIAGAAALAVLAVAVALLVRLDGLVAEELRLTDEDRRWTSNL